MNILGRRKIWYTISMTVIIIGLFFLVVKGLNFGIDFNGGSLLEYGFEQKVSNDEMRSIIADTGIKIEQIQQSAEEGLNGVIIRTRHLETEEVMKIKTAIRDAYPEFETLTESTVGPLIGKELRTNALWAIVIASVAIIIYISVRFEFRFAIVAIITLMHDVLITLGLFSIMGKEINTAFVAAILTIIGYSINDTIVIFDRIRENMKLMHHSSFQELSNRAVVETLPRSINTSATTLIVILGVYFFGGASIKTFMLALFIGMFAGTYSSIFIASPLLVTWQKQLR